MKKALLSALSLFVLGTIYGQEKIDKALLKRDLEVLHTNLEAYHTGLYTYTPKQELDHWFMEAQNTLKDLSALEFFRKLNELNPLIKNGHTFFHINPEQRGKDLRMPAFKLYKYQEGFYVKAAENPEVIGKQIVSLNGEPVAEVFEKLLTYEERDGNNSTQPMEELLHSFARTYALNSGNRPYTEVEFMHQGTKSTILLPTIPFEAVSQKTDSLFDKGGVEFYIEDSVALLRVETFNKAPLKKAQYASKLKRLFKTIAKDHIEHLIIDIRNNGGGHTESVEELISYIHGVQFQFYQDVYRLHKDWDTTIIPERSQYPENISSWAHKKGADGYYRAIAGTDGMKRIKPKKEVYGGNLYILTNGSTLSAAAEFAAFVKQYRKAIFVGEETGGNKTQNTSGEWLIIGLPHSKVFAFIPFVLWKMNVDFENDGYGISPDYWVRNSIQQEIKGDDAVLDFTFELIEKQDTKDDD